MSGGSKNIKQAFLFNLQEQSFYTKQEACQVVLKRAKFWKKDVYWKYENGLPLSQGLTLTGGKMTMVGPNYFAASER